MAKIIRNPVKAAERKYDLIIVGGGIYGVMLCLEASRRNLHSLLLEKCDFGEHTSFNSLRILHGGLRYLQTLDLHRFRESVGERRWFLQTFPDLVKPLPCLMPLYANGLRRPLVLQAALWANHTLSRRRNIGLRSDRHLPPGQVIDAEDTWEIFRYVNSQGLRGGAIWYDASMPDSQRLLIEVLRWACELGATALNYVEACHLMKSKGRVIGVIGVDRETCEAYEFMADIVVNACGPWCRDVATRFGHNEPSLFKPSLAWNVLLNREALSEYAVAVAPKKRKPPITYFLIPWKGRLVAGTGHVPFLGNIEKPMPSAEELREFLNDINLAVPCLDLSMDDILYVFSGLLPVNEEASTNLRSREVIVDHSVRGGSQGFYSISGVKFTTARLVAEKALNQIYPERRAPMYSVRTLSTAHPVVQWSRGIFAANCLSLADKSRWQDALRTLVVEEAVQHLDDLIFRRTNLWEHPEIVQEIEPLISSLLGWDRSRCFEEIKRVTSKFQFT